MGAPPAVQIHSLTGTQASEFPALCSLRISDSELAGLRTQGFISREVRRPEGIRIYKLRFRVGGRQRTRYLGSDPGFIEAIQRELTRLQAGVKRERNLRQLLARSARTVRRAKSTLEPLLAREGWHYHGFTIRRTRSTLRDKHH